MNNKEGIRYIAFGLAVLLLLAVGVWKVRPFPWLNAREARIEGEMTIAGKKYEFKGGKSLLVDNFRSVSGVATSLDGEVVFFDALGAGVSLDEIGCLKGAIAMSDKSILDLSKPGQCNFVIENGVLKGEYSLENKGKITIDAKTDWKPYELSEIQADKTMKIEKGETQQIDAKIMALGGRELTDATVSYKSNNEKVKVDEYGYVEVSEVGEYKDAVTLQAGDKEKVVTILAVEEKVGLESLSPEVVLADGKSNSFKITLKNEINSSIDRVKFFRGQNEEIDCGNTVKESGKIYNFVCSIPSDKAGTWNIVFRISNSEEYAFASKLVALNPEASLSLAVTSKVVMPARFDLTGDAKYCSFNPNDINTDMQDCVSKDQTVFKEDRIYLYPAILWPSFFAKNNAYEINSVSYNKISGFIDGENKTKCNGDVEIDKYGLNTTMSAPALAQYKINMKEPNQSLFSLGYIKYNSDFPSGCVLVLDIEIEVGMKKVDSGTSFNLKGTTQTRSNIRTRKHVLLEGDVMVQDGDISVKKIDPNKSMYSLSASDNIDISPSTDTRISDNNLKNFGINEFYGTDDGTDAYFSNVVDKMREKVSKLLVERGQEISYYDLPSKLASFTASDFSSNPEGWILSLKNRSGDITINTTDICGAKTLVVQGQNVKIVGNIGNKNAGGGCADKGNFGLIVLDGDIIVDPGVTDISGFFFTTGTFYTGESHDKFTLKGAAIAHNFVLQRY